MKKIILALVAIIVLAVGYYLISPLFRRSELNEAAPVPVVTEEVVEVADGDTEPVTPTFTTQGPFPVKGTTGHPASGDVYVIKNGETTTIRYEDFSTINGPDLKVYLAKDLEATEFIDLGRLKATDGDINYEVPAGVNVDEYPYVLTWCVLFSVLFNSAEISG